MVARPPFFARSPVGTDTRRTARHCTQATSRPRTSPLLAAFRWHRARMPRHDKRHLGVKCSAVTYRAVRLKMARPPGSAFGRFTIVRNRLGIECAKARVAVTAGDARVGVRSDAAGFDW